MTFDAQPSLTGELVGARPLRPADLAGLLRAAADPLIWEQHPDRERHRPERFRRFFRDALASGGALTVRDATTGEIIGSSRYHGYDPRRREVEIGWTFLARSHWGGSCNGELKRLMLRHAFGAVDSVVFLVAPGNLRSRRAVERIGAVPDGDRRDGTGQPSLLYRLAAADWDSRSR
ncbi:N-acetyltransferase [Actinoplanes sp. ATCC 53533]|uniref:GNAT family N-acetyltransferase n=1 Tax=Actinoplanes sp. ATCC 53533 TaxID=1288362 RepID=UPI000F78A6DC|nr:GNAT family N-acetyltransferase [Actinoplanes sp. ATCC 53533]RSM46286.1 N-acetyltransferase [Actinoplanes sp. ATCC 53533]